MVGTAGGTRALPDAVRDIPLASGTTATGYAFVDDASSLSGRVFADTDADGAVTPASSGSVASASC